MKIFTSAQIHELDKYTIEHEPISSLNLMERAAKALTRAIEEEWTNRTPSPGPMPMAWKFSVSTGSLKMVSSESICSTASGTLICMIS